MSSADTMPKLRPKNPPMPPPRKVSPSGELTPPTEVSNAVCYLIERGDVTGRIVEVDPKFHRSSI